MNRGKDVLTSHKLLILKEIVISWFPNPCAK
jgi:hypothetical protein